MLGRIGRRVEGPGDCELASRASIQFSDSGAQKAYC